MPNTAIMPQRSRDTARYFALLPSDVQEGSKACVVRTDLNR
jgi:hypothetical protein